MSSVKRWAEENGLLPHHDQAYLDAYYDGDQQIGYRDHDISAEEYERIKARKLKIIIEIPTADAEALYRFIKSVNPREQSKGDPYEASRLEGALDALIEAFEVNP